MGIRNRHRPQKGPLGCLLITPQGIWNAILPGPLLPLDLLVLASPVVPVLPIGAAIVAQNTSYMLFFAPTSYILCHSYQREHLHKEDNVLIGKTGVTMTGEEVIKILEENDWQLDRIRGSHHIMKKDGLRSVPVPVPVHRNQDLPKGLLSALKRQTGIDFSNP